ncbi:MAG: TRAP transporter large permease subunit [Zestosphaera sp.]
MKNLLGRALRYARLALIIIYAVLILYYFTTGWEGARKFVVIMVPVSVVVWVIESLYRRDPLIPKVRNLYANALVGIVFIALSLLSGYYINENFWDLVSVRMGFYTQTDLIMGALIAVVILWFGAVKYPIIFAITMFFLLNALYGRYFPGILNHPGLSYSRLIAAVSVDFSTGVFESLSQIATTVISAFMLFVGILSGFGLVEATNRLVLSKLRSPKLIPQTNILVGVPVGMVTGSAGAATATVGSLTVPIVKTLGVPLAMASAMAAAAGIGAQLMPPVMGAAAFVMADALGVPYFEVMIRGFVPALVFFAGLAAAIYFISLKSVRADSVEGGSTATRSRLSLLDYVHVLLFASGILVLIVLMASWVYAPLAAIRSAGVVLAAVIFVNLFVGFRRRLKALEVIKDIGVKTVKALEFFSIETANLTLLLALLGILKALFTVTGLSLKMGSAIVSLGAGNLYLVILLSYAFGYIVGMGVPPLGTYVIVYPVVVPALMRLGIRPWAAQFTAFFIGVHAEFAPPMSVAAATISRIAKVSFTSVLKELVKMGIGLPLIIAVTPLKPELVLAPGIEQILTGAELALGIVGIEVVAYWALHHRKILDVALKALLVVSSALLIFTRGLYEILGLVLTLPLVVYAFLRAWKVMKAARQA